MTNLSKKKSCQFIVAVMTVVLLTLIDLFTKKQAVILLKTRPSFSVIPGVLEFCYLENYGAAWGMLRNFRWLFLLIVAVLLIAFPYLYAKIPDVKRYLCLKILFLFFLAGALGNGIDRLVYGYVRDFIYISLIDFPVFNLADCYVTVSMFLAMIIYRKEIKEWITSS